MFEEIIFLNQFDSVKEFVDIATQKDYDIELLSGKYIVNAKSIMGVFSLDLTRPIMVRAHCESSAELSKQLAPFKVSSENSKEK